MSKEYSQEELIAYMNSWRPALDGVKKQYNQLQSGAMSGIVLIVGTIGFNFDNISKLYFHEKALVCLSLLSLIFSVGNILNCIQAINFIDGLFAGTKSRLIIDDIDRYPHAELKKLEVQVRDKFFGTTLYSQYSYWCLLFSISLGIICFLSILIRF